MTRSGITTWTLAPNEPVEEMQTLPEESYEEEEYKNQLQYIIQWRNRREPYFLSYIRTYPHISARLHPQSIRTRIESKKQVE